MSGAHRHLVRRFDAALAGAEQDVARAWFGVMFGHRHHGRTMNRLVACALFALAVAPVRAQTPDDRLRTDWANLARYRDANAKLPPPAPGENRVVFMGNSITDSWAPLFDSLFPGKPYIGRGISAQTTPQMLVRFRQDVVALHPKVVVILAGTNDIAGNTGPSTLEMIEDNLASMAEIAQANGIRVVLASVLPVYDYPWRPGLSPAQKIVDLNRWIKGYAEAHHAVYLDFHSAMADARLGLPPELSRDGVHPNEAGYRIMAPLTQRAIEQALSIGGDRR
jgi:lysophospholipase L1-like esterase